MVMGAAGFITSFNIRRTTILSLATLVFAFAMATPVHAATHPKKAAWGAIAYEPDRRATGYSYDFKTAREAKIEALKQCRDPACEVLVSHRARSGQTVCRHGCDPRRSANQGAAPLRPPGM